MFFFSVDNSEFSEDTPEGKNTRYATAMVVFHQKPTKDHETVLEIDATMKTKSLPQESLPDTNIPVLCPSECTSAPSTPNCNNVVVKKVKKGKGQIRIN